MNKIDIKDLYKKQQESIRAPKALKRETVDLMVYSAACATDNDTSSKATAAHVLPERKVRSKSLKTIGFAAVACLTALALAFGIPAITMSTGTSTGYDFSIKAYAASSDSILELGDDGKIIFERKLPFEGISDQYETEGYYTGCLFRVEGDNIKTVTASISKGMIYRYTSEEFKIGDDPKRWDEALLWNPASRGLGEYYQAYDEVEPAFIESGYEKDSPENLGQIRLSKKLGEVASISSSDYDLTNTYLGLWTNEPYGSVDNRAFGDVHAGIIDTFDGETLTVTVEFEDGHYTTQTIELHSAFFEVTPERNQKGNMTDSVLIPKILDEENLPEDATVLLSLYGEVIKTTDSPFSGSSEKINEFESTVDEPYQFDELPEIYCDEDGNEIIVPIDASHIYQPGTPLICEDGYNEDSTVYELNLTNVERLDDVPSYVALDFDTLGSGFDYFNRFNEQMRGFTIAEDGTLTEGYSCVVIDLEITTLESESTSFFGPGGIAALNVDRTGYITSWHGWELCSGVWNDMQQSFTTIFELEPNETKHIKVIEILPDNFLDDSDLIFLALDSSSSEIGIDLSEYF